MEASTVDVPFALVALCVMIQLARGHVNWFGLLGIIPAWSGVAHFYPNLRPFRVHRDRLRQRT
ncbi:hypothetical protein ABIA32_006644 [Streptacidiphilus sp. MAP12-20]